MGNCIKAWCRDDAVSSTHLFFTAALSTTVGLDYSDSSDKENNVSFIVFLITRWCLIDTNHKQTWYWAYIIIAVLNKQCITANEVQLPSYSIGLQFNSVSAASQCYELSCDHNYKTLERTFNLKQQIKEV